MKNSTFSENFMHRRVLVTNENFYNYGFHLQTIFINRLHNNENTYAFTHGFTYFCMNLIDSYVNVYIFSKTKNQVVLN